MYHRIRIENELLIGQWDCLLIVGLAEYLVKKHLVESVLPTI